MRTLVTVIVMLVISIFLTVVSDYVGENRRYDVIQDAVERIGEVYIEMQVSAPKEAAELDKVLIKEAGYSIQEILDEPEKLEAKGVKALGKNGLRVRYIHSVYPETVGYIMDNLLRFVLFLLLTGAITYLVGRMSILERVVIGSTGSQCPIPETVIRQQITVTLAEVLSNEPALAKQLASPNESFMDKEVLQGIKSFCNGNARSGLTLVRTNCEYREYADVALLLDRGAKSSIYSTNVGTPEDLFTMHKTEVSEHLEEVNNRASSPRAKTGVSVMRCQIHLSEPDKVKYDTFLSSGTGAANDYLNLFKNPPNINCNELIVGQSLSWLDFLGDYLVYDNSIILKFDRTTRVLMLLVGKEVVEQHVSVFSK